MSLTRVVAELKRISQPCSSGAAIAQVGAISANNDTEIGNLLADAMLKVGAEGVVTVEEGKTFTTELEHVDGMTIAQAIQDRRPV